MRSAPPVGVTYSGGGAWRGAQAGLAALAAGVFIYWLWPLLAAAFCVAAAAAGLAWRAARPQPVQLRWDGSSWSADGEAGEVDLMLDLQRWLLLRFRPAGRGRARWLPVPDAEAGASRHGLRAALYARAAPGSADG